MAKLYRMALSPPEGSDRAPTSVSPRRDILARLHTPPGDRSFPLAQATLWPICVGCLTALRISGGRTGELARVDDRPLQPLDGRRAACSAGGVTTAAVSCMRSWAAVQSIDQARQMP